METEDMMNALFCEFPSFRCSDAMKTFNRGSVRIYRNPMKLIMAVHFDRKYYSQKNDRSRVLLF
jgi:hypothetical protein